MPFGLLISVLCHAALLFWAVFSMRAVERLPADDTPTISAEIITPTEFLRLKQGAEDSKKLETKAKDEPKPDESKNETKKPDDAPPPRRRRRRSQSSRTAAAGAAEGRARTAETARAGKEPDPIAKKIEEPPPPPSPLRGRRRTSRNCSSRRSRRTARRPRTRRRKKPKRKPRRRRRRGQEAPRS